MFKVNDYVVYSSTGVCKIIDIRKDKDISDNDIEYYVLQPAYHSNMTIKTPVNNPKVLMRNIITKDEVLALIDAMPEKESIWIDNDRKRFERFKTALRTGESEEWVKLVKSIQLKKQEQSDLGKKLLKTDEEIMNAAEKNLNEEFALALNISPEEVVSYILERIPS
ncbi:MAG: CarD family transcriptional regulator [Bacillota bacterium]|nr:CarD family transcriptional regulator [Bacillota bacterium]